MINRALSEVKDKVVTEPGVTTNISDADESLLALNLQNSSLKKLKSSQNGVKPPAIINRPAMQVLDHRQKLRLSAEGLLDIITSEQVDVSLQSNIIKKITSNVVVRTPSANKQSQTNQGTQSRKQVSYEYSGESGQL